MPRRKKSGSSKPLPKVKFTSHHSRAGWRIFFLRFLALLTAIQSAVSNPRRTDLFSENDPAINSWLSEEGAFAPSDLAATEAPRLDAVSASWSLADGVSHLRGAASSAKSKQAAIRKELGLSESEGDALSLASRRMQNILQPMPDVTVYGAQPQLVRVPRNTFDGVPPLYSITSLQANGAPLPSWMGYSGFTPTTRFNRNFDAFASAPLAITWVGNHSYSAIATNTIPVTLTTQGSSFQAASSITIANSVIRTLTSDGNSTLFVGGTLSSIPSIGVYRLTTPTQLQFLANFTTDSNPARLHVLGSSTLVVQTVQSLYVFNVSAQGIPTQVARLNCNPTASHAKNNLIAAVLSGSYVQFYNLSLSALGSVTTSSNSPTDLVFGEDDSTLYIADTYSGVVKVDSSLATAPFISGGINPNGVGKQIAYRNGLIYFYVLDNTPQLQPQIWVIDATAAAMRLMANYNLIDLNLSVWDRDYKIFIEGNRLFISTNNIGGSKYLYVFDPGPSPNNLGDYVRYTFNALMSLRKQSFVVRVTAAGSVSTTFTVTVGTRAPSIKISPTPISTLSQTDFRQAYDLVSAVVPDNPQDLMSTALANDNPVLANTSFVPVNYVPSQTASFSISSATRLAFSKDGQLVAANLNGNGLTVINATTGSILADFRTVPGPYAIFGIIPLENGDILFKNVSGVIRFNQTLGIQSRLDYGLPTAAVTANRNGSVLFQSRYALASTYDIDTVNVTDSTRLPVVSTKTSVPGASRMSISEDGTKLVTSDGLLNVYQVSPTGVVIGSPVSVDVTVTPNFLAFYGSRYILMGHAITGLVVYDIAKLSQSLVTVAGTYPTRSALLEVVVDKASPQRAFLVLGPDGVHIVSLNDDFSQIRYKSSITMPAGGIARSIAVRGLEAWLAVENRGLLYYRVSSWDNTHTFQGTVPYATHGAYLANVVVSDPLGSQVTYPIPVDVGNRAPVANTALLSSWINSLTAETGVPATLSLPAGAVSDPDRDALIASGVIYVNGQALTATPGISYFGSSGDYVSGPAQFSVNFLPRTTGIYPVQFCFSDTIAPLVCLNGTIINPDRAPATIGYQDMSLAGGLLRATQSGVGIWSHPNGKAISFNVSYAGPGVTADVDLTATVRVYPRDGGQTERVGPSVVVVEGYDGIYRVAANFSVAWPNTAPVQPAFVCTPMGVGLWGECVFPAATDVDLGDSARLTRTVAFGDGAPAANFYSNTTRGNLTASWSGTPTLAQLGLRVVVATVSDGIASTQVSTLVPVVSTLTAPGFNASASGVLYQNGTIVLRGMRVSTPAFTLSYTISFDNKVKGEWRLAATPPSAVQVVFQATQAIVAGQPTDVDSFLQSDPLTFSASLTNRDEVVFTETASDSLGQVVNPSSKRVAVIPVDYPFTATTSLVDSASTTPSRPTTLVVNKRSFSNINNEYWRITGIQFFNPAGVLSASGTNTNGWQITLSGVPTVEEDRAEIIPALASQNVYTVQIAVSAMTRAGAPLSAIPILYLNTTLSVTTLAIQVPPKNLAPIGVGIFTVWQLPPVLIEGDNVTDLLTVSDGPLASYDASTARLAITARDTASITLTRQACAVHDPINSCAFQTYTSSGVRTLTLAGAALVAVQQDLFARVKLADIVTPKTQPLVRVSVDGIPVEEVPATSNLPGVFVNLTSSNVSLDAYELWLNVLRTTPLPFSVSTTVTDVWGQTPPALSHYFSVIPVVRPAVLLSPFDRLSLVSTQPTTLIIDSSRILDPDAPYGSKWQVAELSLVNTQTQGLVASSAGALQGWTITGILQAPGVQQAVSLTPPPDSHNLFLQAQLRLQFFNSTGAVTKTLAFNVSTPVGSAEIIIPSTAIGQIGVNQRRCVGMSTPSEIGTTSFVSDRITNLLEGWTYNGVTRELCMHPSSEGVATLIREVCDLLACNTRTDAVVVVPTIRIRGLLAAQTGFLGRAFAYTFPVADSPVGLNITRTLEDATTSAPAPVWLQPHPITGVCNTTVPADANSLYSLIAVYTDSEGNQYRLAVTSFSMVAALQIQIAQGRSYDENDKGFVFPRISYSYPGALLPAQIVIEITPAQAVTPLVDEAIVNATGMRPVIGLNRETASLQWSLSGVNQTIGNSHVASIAGALTQYFFGTIQGKVRVLNGIDPSPPASFSVIVNHVPQDLYVRAAIQDRVRIEGDPTEVISVIGNVLFGNPDMEANVGYRLVRVFDNSSLLGLWSPSGATTGSYALLSTLPVGVHELNPCVLDSYEKGLCAPFRVTINPRPVVPVSLVNLVQQYKELIGGGAAALIPLLKALQLTYRQIDRSRKEEKSKQAIRATLIKRNAWRDEYSESVKNSLVGIVRVIIVTMLNKYHTAEADDSGSEYEGATAAGSGERPRKLTKEAKYDKWLKLLRRLDGAVDNEAELWSVGHDTLVLLFEKIEKVVGKDGIKKDANLANKIIYLDHLIRALSYFEIDINDIPRAFEKDVMKYLEEIGELIKSALKDGDDDQETRTMGRLALTLCRYLFYVGSCHGRATSVNDLIKLVSNLMTTPGLEKAWYQRTGEFLYYGLLPCTERPEPALSIELKLILKTIVALLSRFITDDTLGKVIVRFFESLQKQDVMVFTPTAVLWEDKIERLQYQIMLATEKKDFLIDILKSYLGLAFDNPHVLQAYNSEMDFLLHYEGVRSTIARGAETELVPVAIPLELSGQTTLINKTKELCRQVFYILYAEHLRALNTPFVRAKFVGGPIVCLSNMIGEYRALSDKTDPLSMDIKALYVSALQRIVKESRSKELSQQAKTALTATGHSMKAGRGCAVGCGSSAGGTATSKLNKTMVVLEIIAPPAPAAVKKAALSRHNSLWGSKGMTNPMFAEGKGAALVAASRARTPAAGGGGARTAFVVTAAARFHAPAAARAAAGAGGTGASSSRPALRVVRRTGSEEDSLHTAVAVPASHASTRHLLSMGAEARGGAHALGARRGVGRTPFSAVPAVVPAGSDEVDVGAPTTANPLMTARSAAAGGRR